MPKKYFKASFPNERLIRAASSGIRAIHASNNGYGFFAVKKDEKGYLGVRDNYFMMICPLIEVPCDIPDGVYRVVLSEFGSSPNYLAFNKTSIIEGDDAKNILDNISKGREAVKEAIKQKPIEISYGWKNLNLHPSIITVAINAELGLIVATKYLDFLGKPDKVYIRARDNNVVVVYRDNPKAMLMSVGAGINAAK